MAPSYEAEYPHDVSVLNGIHEFFQRFYQISDDPDAHEAYVGFFTEDATFVLASRTVRGREAILDLRKGARTRVRARRHVIRRVFPFGHGAAEFMLHGTVAYVFADGRAAEVDWAATARLIKEGAGPGLGWRFVYYQVYLDTAAQ